MAIHKLSAGKIRGMVACTGTDEKGRLYKAGTKHSDGGGLILQVTEPGQASWYFRYFDKPAGKELWPSLGSANTFTLEQAREKARLCRVELAEGRSPKEYVAGGRAQPTGKLFSTALEEYLAAKAPTWSDTNRDRGLKHYRFQFAQIPEFTALPLRRIDQDAKNEALGHWKAGTKTRRLVSFYIEAIIRYAETGQLRLPGGGVEEGGHHAAMPWADVPAFFAKLGKVRTTDARALGFTILTAARTDEVIGAKAKRPATWADIVEEGGKPVWVVPLDRIKARREHRVPLTPQMVSLLGPRKGDDVPLFKVSSQNALLETLREIAPGEATVHGFRSSFEDWGAEATSFPRDLVKLCTAHDKRTKTDRAYQRSDLLEKRREIMSAWAAFVTGAPAT